MAVEDFILGDDRDAFNQNKKKKDEGPQPDSFNMSGPNEQWVTSNFGSPGEASNDGADVVQNIGKYILAQLRDTADAIGENPIVFEQMFEQYEGDFWRDVNQDLFTGNMVHTNQQGFVDAPMPGTVGPDYYLTTQGGFKALMGYARNWWGSRLGPGVAAAWSGSSGGGGGGGGRGRRGSTLPSESEIRNQFDLNKLGRRASDLWRAYLLDEPENARDLAKSYVDEIVKHRGQKKIDFDAYIEQKIEGTDRFANIMKNKPADMRADQYIQGYYQQALQVLRPEGAAETAIGGAQMGADTESFNQRLQRSREFRQSSPFMQGLEGRLRSMKGVLKG